jgi:TolA-binding protein
MKRIVGSLTAGLVLLLGLSFASPAAAQATVSATDIQRLQERVFDAEREIRQLRAANPDRASTLESELDELRDEVIYLKVKLRKEDNVTRAEYASLRDRIDDVSLEARSGSSSDRATTTHSSSGTGHSAHPGTSSAGSGTGVGAGSGSSSTSSTSRSTSTSSSTVEADIPVGTELDVRLQTTLNSGTTPVEERFEATTVEALRTDTGAVLVPAGSIVRGVVSDVKSAGRIERKGSLTLSFDQITINGRAYTMRASVAPFEGKGVKGDAAKIGTGAGVGAIIGGILGGFKGALAGILIGGGGVVAATEGQEVNLPAGTVLRIRLDTPIDVR